MKCAIELSSLPGTAARIEHLCRQGGGGLGGHAVWRTAGARSSFCAVLYYDRREAIHYDRRGAIYHDRRGPIHYDRRGAVYHDRRGPIHYDRRGAVYHDWRGPIQYDRRGPVYHDWRRGSLCYDWGGKDRGREGWGREGWGRREGGGREGGREGWGREGGGREGGREGGSEGGWDKIRLNINLHSYTGFKQRYLGGTDGAENRFENQHNYHLLPSFLYSTLTLTLTHSHSHLLTTVCITDPFTGTTSCLVTTGCLVTTTHIVYKLYSGIFQVDNA